MELVTSDRDKITIEMSMDEFLVLTGVVYSVDQFFHDLDPVPYDLDEKAVSRLAVAIGGVQKAHLARPRP